jgi:iron complex outermembrane recepter protein
MDVDGGAGDSRWPLGGFPKLLAPTGVPLDDSVLQDPHRISTNLPSVSVLENYGTAGELDYKLGGQVSLKSLTAWRGLRGHLDLDADSSSINILRTLVSPIQQDQLSEELDLTARWANLTGVAGVYYFHEHDAEPLTLNVPAAGVSNIVRGHLTNQSTALFGQAELALTTQWSVIAGLRYSHESKDYDVSNKWTLSAASDPAVAEAAPTIGAPFFPDPFAVATSRSASALTPKAGLNFKPTDDVLLYLSATRGFKSGGFDYGAPDAADAARGYAPEYIWSYETGVKSEWLSHRLRVNLDAFHYNYTNLQVEVFVPPANAVTENAASARVNGTEAEIRAQPSRQLALYANVAWLEATYSSYPGAYVKAFGTFDATGKRLNHAPNMSTTVGSTYRVSMGGWGATFAGVDYHWQGREFFTPANDGINGVEGYLQQQGPYGILSARVGWISQDGHWEVIASGSNLTDRFYVTSTADYTAAIAGRPGDPRTYRLQVTRVL